MCSKEALLLFAVPVPEDTYYAMKKLWRSGRMGREEGAAQCSANRSVVMTTPFVLNNECGVSVQYLYEQKWWWVAPCFGLVTRR